jgi:hypothetical protein
MLNQTLIKPRIAWEYSGGTRRRFRNVFPPEENHDLLLLMLPAASICVAPSEKGWQMRREQCIGNSNGQFPQSQVAEKTAFFHSCAVGDRTLQLCISG